MVRSTKSTRPLSQPLALRLPLDAAAAKIQAQINEGESLLSKQPSSVSELDAAKDERRIWSDYNIELLSQIFTSTVIAEEYSAFYGASFSLQPSFAELVEDHMDSIRTSLTRLRSIYRRLELIPAPESDALPTGNSPARVRDSGIFLVHGHNNEAKETVARFLERLGLRISILHEQPDKGRTIIEKFEDHASVGYAVVLLTEDDVGASRATATELRGRARQNVVLELGYFLGKLGRSHVCALREDGVELPSDLAGVLYIPFDAAGAWRLSLAAEIKSAGIDVDMNRAL
jgi:predicted nucleotide-binding protein